MPEIYLMQPRLYCSACKLFARNKERIQRFKAT